MRCRLLFTQVLFLLIISALVAAPASAQYFGRNKVQYDDFDFKKIESEHFEYYYYPEKEQAVQDAARMAERWYHRHSQTFLREFTERKPLIFYANDADFQQTNVISGQIGQGTGGVTESLKERVTMPMTGSYAETDHVLGHELVHSFQYDIGLRERNRGFQLNRLPLWLVEGMAEYLSVGREDSHTAMWLRAYLLEDDLPSTQQLTREPQTYFPYRFGQAYMAYVGGKYGDPAVTNLFKLAGRAGVDSSFVYALGISADSLSNEWKQAVRDTYEPLMEGRTPIEDAGEIVLGNLDEDNQLNLSPSISPDGRYVAYITRENIFTINLFVADAQTGETVQKLRGTASDPHFDALRFINSAGSWSPDGRRLAFVTFTQGDNELSIINVESGRIERRIKIDGVSAFSNPAWSPNGETIAFSGLDGGISDLYLLDLESGRVRQLTNDRYADMQPTWAPDGETIAFATDRGPNGTSFETLDYAKLGLGLIDVETGETQTVRPFGRAQHHNPQFSIDGQSLFFISDQDGFRDIYRYALGEEETYRVTDLQTGASGITATSPAMTIARQNGRMMFSAFSKGGYTVHTLPAEATEGEPVEPLDGIATASLLPPYRAATTGLVSNYLTSPTEGLPTNLTFSPNDYSGRLQLDYIAPPTVGVGVRTGGYYGTQAGIAGGVGFFFSDMLGNKNLSLAVQANGTFKDIGGQAVYLDLGNRINYGVAAAHIPLLQGGFRRGPDIDLDGDGSADAPTIDRVRQRLFIDQLSGLVNYPFTTTRRLELNLGGVRYGFDEEIERFAVDPRTGAAVFVGEPNGLDLDPVYFLQGGAAYVGDFSYFGFTSPVQGGRFRFGISPRVGTFSFAQATADYRRYLFFEPFTFAFRGLHIGNYGITENQDPNEGDPTVFSVENLTREYLGSPYYPGFVRGYSFNSFDSEECAFTNAGCGPLTNRLFGTRIALASAEVRLPLFGVEEFGLINFPYLPTELTAFVDAGLAWTGDEPPVFRFETDRDLLRNSEDRYPVVSVGTSARINLLGALVFEIFYAYPFQRPDKGAHFGLQFMPGW